GDDGRTRPRGAFYAERVRLSSCIAYLGRAAPMLAFFQKQIIGGIGIFVGSAITLGSLILHAYALHEMGLPIEIWVAIGLGIFILSVVGILYKSWNENQRIVPAGKVNQTPVSTSAENHPLHKTMLLDEFLVPVDIYPIHDINARGFPHKLCVSLKNESG